MPVTGIAQETIFAGDYRVLKPLGRGGFGSVYAVEQLSTGRKLALKLMHSEHVTNHQLLAKFEQEVKITSRIDSDHVAHVVSAGVDADTKVPWLVMELLDGQTLEERIQASGAMRPPDVLLVVEQICHALGAAHASGIIHRDLKPENIFLAKQRVVGRSEIVKVLDFGIAKILAEAGTTRTGIIGTPFYMAPEQYEGRGIRAQTDLWALGLITFSMLTAGQYWAVSDAGESGPTSLMYLICMGEMPTASARAAELGARLPPGFDDWFAGCVTRDRSKRYGSAAELLDGLRPLLAISSPVHSVERDAEAAREQDEKGSATEPPPSANAYAPAQDSATRVKAVLPEVRRSEIAPDDSLTTPYGGAQQDVVTPRYGSNAEEPSPSEHSSVKEGRSPAPVVSPRVTERGAQTQGRPVDPRLRKSQVAGPWFTAAMFVLGPVVALLLTLGLQRCGEQDESGPEATAGTGTGGL